MSYYRHLSRFFSFNISNHKEYLVEIEGFLKSERMAQRATHIDDLDLWDEVMDDRLIMLGHFYPDMLRKSLFLALYSLAETELRTICRHVEKRDKLSLSLNDIFARGGFISKIRKYLEKLAFISFPGTLEWTELENYRKLRNCVVHNQGKLTSSGDDKYLRNTYVPSQYPYLSTDDDQVVFHQGFCEKAFDVFDACIHQLCVALDSRPSR
jgi:hypothetical protein